MLTFKEFLLAEYDQAQAGAPMPPSGGSSQSNVVAAQLKGLQAKQQALMKKKSDLQARFDSDMQRAQVGINSLSEDNPAAQPAQSNPAAQPSSSTNPTTPDNPQMMLLKQKQQASMKLKATGDKQIDDELKRNQGQIDALSKQAQKQDQTTQPSPQAPVSGMGTMARSNNPEKTATPSGNKTTQSIAPSSRIGFGTSFG